MKSRLNFIKSLAAGLFGGATLFSPNTVKAAPSETNSTEATLAELSKKVEELTQSNKVNESQESTFGQDGMIGEIRMFGGNFPPRSWAFCDGQLLAISSNSALFSILGTTYGGDGRTSFALPELRGRVAMHAGNGPGLTSRPLGQKSGSETTQSFGGNISSVAGPGRSGNVNVKNNNQPENNIQPFTTVNYIICLFGQFPSRS